MEDSNAYIDWLEKAISENYIKYYDYTEFTNKEEISNGSFGNVFRTNRKDSDTAMAVKYSFNLTVKEIVYEVNHYNKYYNIIIIFSFLSLTYFKILVKNATRS